MIEPHGGRLINRIASEEHADQVHEEIADGPTIDLSRDRYQDLLNLANGRFSPLTGFMSRNDVSKVVHDMTLEDGTVWSLPITLDINPDTAAELTPGRKAGLVHDDDLVGAIDVSEVFKFNREETARAVFDTADPDHPGVRTYLGKEEYLVGGDVVTLAENRYSEYDLFPAETRVLFGQQDWDEVVGFQTRNAPHRAHEYIQKTALEQVDGLLVQPKLGAKKPGDYRDATIMGAYRTLIDEYYVREQVALSVFPSPMRYAGPREAVFDAIVRKNQGCTHFVIGRDHAGVEDYYDGFDAHRVFDRIGDIGIEPMFYSYAYYCERCDGMASAKTCPHDARHHVHPSGTEIRADIRDGVAPSDKLMRPEVSAWIMDVDDPFVSDKHGADP